ncbi:MAG: hypothetical protein ACXVDD_20425, partial [Polyangia bacterium]
MRALLIIASVLPLACAPKRSGVSSFTISPANAVVDLVAGADGRYSASSSFVATVALDDGSSRDVSAEVAWSIPTPASIARGLAVTGAAGVYTLTATRGSTKASATFTARLHGPLYGPGFTTADGGKLYGAPAAPAPSIAYPLDGTLFPANLAPIAVHVAKSSPAQTIARLHFVAGDAVDALYYAACEPGPNSSAGCYVTLPAALTAVFIFVGESTDLTLSARAAAADGSALGESPPITLAWSTVPLTGGLYYWTTLPPSQNQGNTGIARYDFAGDASKPQIVYTDKGSPADHSGGDTCVGCHAITHDGKRMALTIGGSSPSDWMLLDV